jgi:hypothetical protein
MHLLALTVLVAVLVVLFIGAFVIAVGIPFWKSTGTLILSNGEGALVVAKQPYSVKSSAAVTNIPLDIGSSAQAGFFSGTLTLHMLTQVEQVVYNARFALTRQGTGQSNSASNRQSVTFTKLDDMIYPEEQTSFSVTFSTQSGQVYLNVARDQNQFKQGGIFVADSVNYTLFTTFQQSAGPQKRLQQPQPI